MSEDQRPSTGSLLMGEFRRGLKDLQDKVLDPWNQRMATHDELGTIGNPTQAMVTQDVGTVYGHHDAYLDEVASRHIEPPQPEPERELGE